MVPRSSPRRGGLVEAAEGPSHVAVDGLHLLAEEGLDAVAVLVPQEHEGLAGGDVAPEALLGCPAPRPHHEEERRPPRGIPARCSSTRKRLAEASVTPEDDEARPLDDAGDVEPVVLLVHVLPRRRKTLRGPRLTVRGGVVSRRGGRRIPRQVAPQPHGRGAGSRGLERHLPGQVAPQTGRSGVTCRGMRRRIVGSGATHSTAWGAVLRGLKRHIPACGTPLPPMCGAPFPASCRSIPGDVAPKTVGWVAHPGTSWRR